MTPATGRLSWTVGCTDLPGFGQISAHLAVNAVRGLAEVGGYGSAAP